MFLPQISSPPQLSLSFDNPYSFIENKTSNTRRHFLLSKKIRTMPTKTLEDIHEIDENLPSIKSTDDSNLFKEISQPNPLTKDFTQFNFGPRFDTNGVVLSHSIVGKVDSFMSQHIKQGASHYRMESKTFMADGKKTNANEKKFKNSTLGIDESVIINAEKRSSLLKPVGPAKKPQKVKLTKIDLLADLNLSIERHNKAKQDDIETINKLETSDKLYMTKQTRILNLFTKYESKWKNQMNLTKKKIHRKQEDSVVKNADLYRPKQEAAEAFLMTLSDYEKYGDRVWYMTLRLYNVDPNDVKKVLYINDLPDGFKRAIVERRSNVIEKIRKPTEENLDPGLLYKTFTSGEYLNEKIEKNHKILNGVLGGSFKENFENFQVFILIIFNIFLICH